MSLAVGFDVGRLRWIRLPVPDCLRATNSYGNLATTSLDEIWNGEFYVATRTYLSQKSMSPRARRNSLLQLSVVWQAPSSKDVVETRKQWLQAAKTRSGEAGALRHNSHCCSSS